MLTLPHQCHITLVLLPVFITDRSFYQVHIHTGGLICAKAVSVFDTTKSDSLLVTINQSTGVKQVEEAIGFKLYPNPTDYSLNIVIAKPHPELTITITDASGREVARKHYVSNELNTPQQVSVAQLAAGAYFLSINDNGINFSTQFIKQ